MNDQNLETCIADGAKPVWTTPRMETVSVAELTEGDPTISDDGLGDGLFS